LSVSAVFYGKKRELPSFTTVSASHPPPKKITREEFLSYDRDNNLAVTEVSRLVD
jgi:hypothetical protein